MGYRAAGCYRFEDKHLSAIHFEYGNAEFPKIFVSQLTAWELPDHAREILGRSLASHRPLLADDCLAQIADLESQSEAERTRLLDHVVEWMETRPWPAPQRADIEAINEVSQYAAWVLVHGYRVNHYTALINSQRHPSVDSIDKTVALLRAEGVPMKDDIEGMPGSKLRQSATRAVVVDAEMADGDTTLTVPWTYAYLELAERGEIVDSESGEMKRFEGFLGPQATQLFEMTKK